MANAKTKATPQPGIVEVSLNQDDLDALNVGEVVSVRNGRYTIALTPDPSNVPVEAPQDLRDGCVC